MTDRERFENWLALWLVVAVGGVAGVLVFQVGALFGLPVGELAWPFVVAGSTGAVFGAIALVSMAVLGSR